MEQGSDRWEVAQDRCHIHVGHNSFEFDIWWGDGALCFSPIPNTADAVRKAQKDDTMEKHIARVERLTEHVKSHPSDYQAVIALLKARSDMIEHRAWLAMVEKKKRIAEIKRQRKERQNAKEPTKQ